MRRDPSAGLVKLCFNAYLMCMLLLAARAAAQPAARPVTLREVVERARTQAQAVKAAHAVLQRLLAQEQQAEAAYLPRVSATLVVGSAYSNRRVLPDVPRVVSTSLETNAVADVEWAALDFARSARVEEARAMRAGQAAAKEAVELSVEQRAVELYIHAVAAADLTRDTELTVTRRTSQQATIAALVDGGMRPAVDAQRARVDVIQAEQTLQVQRFRTAALQAALAAAVGGDPINPLQPASVDDKVFDTSTEPSEVVALALDHRAELRELRQSIAAREAAHRSALGARLPSAGLAASGSFRYLKQVADDQYSISGSLYDASAGLFVRWTGLDPSTWQAGSVAERATFEARSRFAEVLQAIRAQVVDAAYRVRALQAQREQVTQLVEATHLTWLAQSDRYAAGMASLLELLDAEDGEQRARRQRIEVARDLLLARLELIMACGLGDQILRYQ